MLLLFLQLLVVSHSLPRVAAWQWPQWPLGLQHEQHHGNKPSSGLDVSYPDLNFSSPSPLIFHSLFTLLHQWPNTFFPFGHTIAPCTIPAHIPLYHARIGGQEPPSPEWLAFDPEMSYAILGTQADSHLLTYRTTRTVQCLYFDGTSASLDHPGNMDSQMLLLHNSSADVPEHLFPRPPRGYEYATAYPEMTMAALTSDRNHTDEGFLTPEYDRARGLCRMLRDRDLGGPGWGFEGIVRMNAGFEVIWCNFSSPSLKLLSNVNVSAPLLEGRPDWRDAARRPHRISDNPFIRGAVRFWFEAAARTYGFGAGRTGRGEARVRLDSCGVATFYDPGLEDQEAARIEVERKLLNLSDAGTWLGAPDRALGLKELMRRRRRQRASNVSEADDQHVRRNLVEGMETVLGRKPDVVCSGIDWIETTRQIVNFYSPRLYTLSKLLATDPKLLEPSQIRSWLTTVRDIVHIFYTPHFVYPPFNPTNLSEAFSPHTPNSLSAQQKCISQHRPPPDLPLSPSETLTTQALDAVLTGLCETLLPLFLHNEITWLRDFNNQSAPAPLPGSTVIADLATFAQRGRGALELLMAWLGWVEQWTGCEPGCSVGQICHVPIWPVGGFFGPPFFDRGDVGLWEPRCVDGEGKFV